ncbi:hypothetical protein NIES2100_78230 [Calothrix sp. NIES-2100]|nr:hypothetical protein NIES2100_78230 [Calothrix sp. NIES-2100]
MFLPDIPGFRDKRGVLHLIRQQHHKFRGFSHKYCDVGDDNRDVGNDNRDVGDDNRDVGDDNRDENNHCTRMYCNPVDKKLHPRIGVFVNGQ